MPEEALSRPSATLPRATQGRETGDGAGVFSSYPELIVAVLLFLALTALSWRRWASFDGDLNREWTTPARIAAGERLYTDVAYYYGPLVPWVEGAAFRIFGSTTGTAIGFGLVLATSLLGVALAVSRPFLDRWARISVASVAVGVFAFAPENGALIAPYSLSAVAAIALSFGSILATQRNLSSLAGLLGGLALLAKVEAAPVFLLALLLLPLRRAVLAACVAAAVASSGYGWALRGIPVDDLVTFGPLRHLAMPPEFRELYMRISGLHPSMLPGAVHGVISGGCLLTGWVLLVSWIGNRSARRLVFGGALLVTGVSLWLARSPEPLLTTAVRGLPMLVLGGAVAAAQPLGFSPRRFFQAEAEAKLPFVVALSGLAFLWRTIVWVVPSYPYAPLAAIPALPAAAYLLQRIGRPGPFCWVPVLLAPAFMLPRLIDFYQSPAVEIRSENAVWYLPEERGLVFAQVLEHMKKTGAKDRSLVVIPEASALNFVLGVRSPLRLEQWLPGLLDARADAETARDLETSRPKRVVWFSRSTAEFGGQRLGRDYGKRCTAVLSRDYQIERSFEAAGRTALVLVRKDGPGSPKI
jgi:hypothetical protein